MNEQMDIDSTLEPGLLTENQLKSLIENVITFFQQLLKKRKIQIFYF